MHRGESRLLPGAPRPALALVVLVPILCALWLALTGPGTEHEASLAWHAPIAVAAVLSQLGLLWILYWRARLVSSERRLWRSLRLSAAMLALGMDANLALHIGSASQTAAAAVIALTVLAAFPLTFSALLSWNRYGVAAGGPQEWLNGASGLSLGTGLISCVPAALLPTHPSRALFLALCLQLISWLSLAGTAAALHVVMPARRLDPRGLLLVAATLALAGVDVAGMLSGSDLTALTLATAAAAALAFTACLSPVPAVLAPVNAKRSTRAACALVLGAVGALAVAALAGAPTSLVVLATIGAALASFTMLVLVSTLTDLAASRKEALTDDLTGVGNRRAVVRRLEELSSSSRHCALVMVDVDKFADVNEGLGHTAGDELLQLIARRLEANLEPGTLLGRLAGDEFAIVTSPGAGTSPDGVATYVGARAVAALAEAFQVGGMTLHLSVSAGAASTLPGGGTATEVVDREWRPTDVLRRADAALHAVKDSGRGLALFDPERHSDASGNLVLVEDLRSAIASGQIILHHQPQVDTTTGDVVGVEALVRWLHPERGLLFPGTFIPVAEKHGLMGGLTEIVLGQAVAQVAAWRDAGTVLRMSVNLSAANLLDADLPSRIAELLLRHGVPGSAMVFEVTESMLLSEPENSARILTEIADLGSGISIDDFGTGYASLSYLRALPVTELKLDRSFTSDLLADPRTAAIVSSTITLAHQLGLRVIGEGVEDEATLVHLAAAGCDETQGYLHAKPMPPARIQAWLAGRVSRESAPASL